MTMTTEPEYADPRAGLTYELHNVSVGNTYDPPNDWWRCPLCAPYSGFVGTYQALREHLGNEHNVTITEQAITITVARTLLIDMRNALAAESGVDPSEVLVGPVDFGDEPVAGQEAGT